MDDHGTLPMLKEVDLFGVYIAPFAADAAVAALIFFPLRFLFDRIEIQRWVWHRALFDTATYVIILSVVGLFF